MRTILFITKNAEKFAIAHAAFIGTGIELVQEKLETPEIQGTSVEEISKYSARWAADKLGQAVVTSDAGYFIGALNGFPGPFIKYVNQWLAAEDILRLMNGKTERGVVVRDCLAYCEPGQEPHAFPGEARGALAEHIVRHGKTSIGTLFIPEGHTKTEPELTEEEMSKFWRSHMRTYRDLITFLTHSY